MNSRRFSVQILRTLFAAFLTAFPLSGNASETAIASKQVDSQSWIGGWNPVNWLGGDKREMMSNNGRQLGCFNGKRCALCEN
ncbi:MAG: hypothetical protein ABIO94_07940 [Opitutaceae bacterium]